jgi:hypothetical protein
MVKSPNSLTIWPPDSACSWRSKESKSERKYSSPRPSLHPPCPPHTGDRLFGSNLPITARQGSSACTNGINSREFALVRGAVQRGLVDNSAPNRNQAQLDLRYRIAVVLAIHCAQFRGDPRKRPISMYKEKILFSSYISHEDQKTSTHLLVDTVCFTQTCQLRTDRTRLGA